ncbi:MAG: DUF192 domain-containing protein [Bryobacterales bacterium]|nr:DUF192 domain-containing protein [Bryobacterales bacterium]
MSLYVVTNQTRDKVLADRALLASDSKTRREGLLKRTEFPAGEGLMISPCEAIHMFGMKFAIDVVFYDRKKVVRKVVHSIPKNRIAFCFSASVALELPAGTAKATGTVAGDQLSVEPHAGDR